VFLLGRSSEAVGRVLFVGNVEYGPSLTIEQIDAFLRDVFSPFGDIESVSVSKFAERSRETRNARFAHVCFARRSALEKCLRADEAEYQRNLARVAETWGFGYLAQPQTKQGVSFCFRSLCVFGATRLISSVVSFASDLCTAAE
jgi:RNA recognition motif-containing protein